MQGVAVDSRPRNRQKDSRAEPTEAAYKKAPGNRGQKLRRADEGNRTPNLLITNQLLYQLSYVSGMFES
jgi:hypothetical protein